MAAQRPTRRAVVCSDRARSSYRRCSRSRFAYSTGLTQVLAAVVTEATDQSLCSYAAERLFGPLQIDVEKWWVEPGGYFSGGHSLFLTPRAFEMREAIPRIGVLDLATGIDLGEGYVPKWSPDGTRLAFVAEAGGQLDVFVMDADGTNRVQLTSGAFDTFPIWSPTGDTILFHSAPGDENP